jgi:RNA polymerase sigma factor (sigma-70 family)
VDITETEVVKYIEPVFYFCVKRLNNRQDAEDLASEIMVHILNGIKKYHIESLENWVWRIAHNRYARFINMKNKLNEIPSGYDFTDIQDDYDFVDTIIIVDEYQQVFRYLHTLSSEYRNILVDYYIGELPVKQISQNYKLTETTVKWRLNIGREKIKTRMGEGKMDKVYNRINWRTTISNGTMDANKYLYSQIARAICDAAYEKPLTIEEISLKTGLPTLYIEDELPRLINGDAVVKDGNKYAANFIVLRLRDNKNMETKFATFTAYISDYFAELFKSQEALISKMDFYGTDFTMERLGYIALPFVLRGKISKIKSGLNMKDGLYPPRPDGNWGWFVVFEEETEGEGFSAETGLFNIERERNDSIYFHYVRKYYNYNTSRYGGILWIYKNNIMEKTENGIIQDGVLNDDDRVELLKYNLIVRDGNKYKINFAVFDKKQYNSFIECFNKDDARLDGMLTELIVDIHKSFKEFVPKRLDIQINQWVSIYVSSIIGYVTEELIKRGVLEKPDDKKPLTNGVFYIKDGHLDVRRPPDA